MSKLKLKLKLNWQVLFGCALVALSALVYFIHYLIFRDLSHIIIYLIGDTGFVFLEILFVTLIVNQLITYREKQSMLNKLNMVIGAFFSEVGLSLLRTLKSFDDSYGYIRDELIVNGSWSDKQFLELNRNLKKRVCAISIKKELMPELKSLLKDKRPFLLNLLENYNVMEHESFTEMLWAVFHLTEELTYRNKVDALSLADEEHIAGDIKRAYTYLISEWIDYMNHLRKAYPYLFSLAIRTNPFDDNASIEIN